jgi:hypothetical protein
LVPYKVTKDGPISRAILALTIALEAEDLALTRLDVKDCKPEKFVGSIYGVSLYENRS